MENQITIRPSVPVSSTALSSRIVSGLALHQSYQIAPGISTVSLKESPHHPALRLFAAKEDAQQLAGELGPPWVPFAFTCGYMLTTGWEFRDATGTVKTFCPVPHQLLEGLQALVRELQSGKYLALECMHIIRARLSLMPHTQALPRSYIEAVCFCTLLRLGYPAPCDAPDDWLTVPAWALRMKRRRTLM